MGNTHPIPKQIKTGNISPCNPKGKGDYFISKNTVLNAAKHLKIDPKIAGALLIPIVAVISYFGHSRFSFANIHSDRR